MVGIWALYVLLTSNMGESVVVRSDDMWMSKEQCEAEAPELAAELRKIVIQETGILVRSDWKCVQEGTTT